MIVKLTPDFIANNLVCPEGKRRIEYADTGGSGLYVEVRATSPGQGTFYLRYKDANGKTSHAKICRTDSGLDLDEIRLRAKTLKAEIFLKLSAGIDPRNDTPAKIEVPTLNQYYESDYLPFIKQRNRSWKSTDGVYKRYVKPIFGEMRIKDISRKMVVDFHSEIKSRGLSGATADHGLKCVRHIINTMILNDMATDNPAAKVPLYNDFNEINNVPSPEEFRKLMSVLNNSPSQIALIARALILTGCRLSELTSATWSNCDLDKKVLYIDSKSSKSKLPREIPLSEEAIKVLMQSNTHGKYKYLFVNPRTKTRYYSVHKAWNKIRIKSGLPKLRLHDLRHMAASELAGQGESILIIARYLGHVQVSTAERYSHVSNSVLRRASDKISAAVQNALESDSQ
jgi:integrase